MKKHNQYISEWQQGNVWHRLYMSPSLRAAIADAMANRGAFGGYHLLRVRKEIVTDCGVIWEALRSNCTTPARYNAKVRNQYVSEYKQGSTWRPFMLWTASRAAIADARGRQMIPGGRDWLRIRKETVTDCGVVWQEKPVVKATTLFPGCYDGKKKKSSGKK